MKKVLLINEPSYFHSGYGRYGKELMTHLYNTGKYELYEIACGYTAGNKEQDAKVKQLPWKVFPSAPPESNTEAFNKYNSDKANHYGQMAFNEVAALVKPNVCIQIRDFWFDEWIQTSPFRDYFSYIQLAPTDSDLQNPLWVDFYKRCEGLLTFNDWSKEVLESYKLTVNGAAPHFASPEFQPLDKKECKQKLGLEGKKIIGFVARNQPRKLFGELMQAFSEFLKEKESENVYLYIHAGFPDQGHDIPNLLLQYGIANRVYFTYKCQNCGTVFAAKFSDSLTACYKCGNLTASTPIMTNTVNNKELAVIMNCFDLYTQYAKNEGFGIGQVEAASCAVPILSVDFSAMSDVVRKLGGYPIKVAAMEYETETGRNMAHPDIQDTVKGWKEMIGNSEELGRQAYENCKKHYGIEQMMKPWIETIDSMPIKEWGRPFIKTPAQFNDFQMGHRQYVHWIIDSVLQKPSLRDSYWESLMINYLNMGVEPEVPGMAIRYRPFNRRMLYERAIRQVQEDNAWQELRFQLEAH